MEDYKQLAINGSNRLLCFKTGAIRILKKQFNYDIYAIFQQMNGIGAMTVYLPEIVYSAMACYCSIEKKPVDFTIEEITSWMDGLSPDELTKVIMMVVDAYINPLKEDVKASAEGSTDKEEKDPFHLGHDRSDVPGADADAPVGAGLIHVQRAAAQTKGIR